MSSADKKPFTLTPDQEMDLIAQRARNQAILQQKELFGDWIERRKSYLLKEIGSASKNPAIPDSVFRAYCGALDEIYLWEKHLIQADQNLKQASGMLDRWRNRK